MRATPSWTDAGGSTWGLVRGVFDELRAAPDRAVMLGAIRTPAVLVAVSIVAGTLLALACSYEPLALWAVMVSGTFVGIIRRWQQGRIRRSALAGGQHALPGQTFTQETEWFRAWFTQHNLFFTTAGLVVTLLVWHAFGPTSLVLSVMAAALACCVFTVLGAVRGRLSPVLGICWRMPCPRATCNGLRATLLEAGAVVVLGERLEYAHRRDWAETGGRLHSDALVIRALGTSEHQVPVVRYLDRDPVALDLGDFDARERSSRWRVLAALFAAALILAFLPVWFLAGDAPPPGWRDIAAAVGVSGGAHARRDARDVPAGRGSNGDSSSSGPSASSDGAGGAASPSGRPESGGGTIPAGGGSPDRALGSSDGRAARGDRARADGSAAGSSPSPGRSGNQPSLSAPPAQQSSSDTAASSQSGGAQAGDPRGRDPHAGGQNGQQGSGSQGGAAGQGQGKVSSAGQGNSQGDQAAGQGARGRGEGRGDRATGQAAAPGERATPGSSGGQSEQSSRSYGTSGAPPKVGGSGAALPPLAPNPGDAVTIVLPPFGTSASREGDDESSPTRPRIAAKGARGTPYRTPVPAESSSKDPRPLEPSQRWPNWVYQLLHK